MQANCSDSNVTKPIIASLHRDGIGFCSELLPELSTIEIAHLLGTVVDVGAMLPASGISNVQPLKPHQAYEVGKNRYSGNYGLFSFPLHTDLAHWAVPPRYFVLRCIVGSQDVFSEILASAFVVEQLGMATLQKAVLRIRRPQLGRSSLARALSNHMGTTIFRWDSVFLKPVNDRAAILGSFMQNIRLNSGNSIRNILLKSPGDTLMIDNWRMLHGRSAVSAQSTHRHVERVYLSEVREC